MPAVPLMYGRHFLRWDHEPPRQLAHPDEMVLSVGVGILFEYGYPQSGAGQGRHDLPESPPEEVAAVRVLEVTYSFDETGGCQTAPGFANIVAEAFFEEARFLAERIRTGVVPGLIEHLRRRVEVHEHEASAGPQDCGDAAGPGPAVRESADDAVGGEDDVETTIAVRRRLQPVVDVGAHEVGGDAGLRGEPDVLLLVASVPGATAASVGVLMSMHVVAWAISVGTLTTLAGRDRVKRSR